MNEYEGMQIQVGRRIDGQYFARIYEQSLPDPLFSTAYYPTEEQAVEEAREIIRDHLAMNGNFGVCDA